MLGASVYTFSIILAVFLIGLGIGSSCGAWASGWARQPAFGLGCCQLLLTAAIAWAAYVMAQSLPYWPIDPSLSVSPWFTFQLDLMRCLWAVLPASCLWGASFPLALAAAASPGEDLGRLTGSVYAANTVGAIVGSVGFSLLAVGWLGTRASQQMLIVLSAVAAGTVFCSLLWQVGRVGVPDYGSHEGPLAPKPSRATGRAVWSGPRGVGHVWALVGLTCIGGGLAGTVPAAPRGLIAYGRNLPTWTELPDFLYVGEGMNASIAVSEFPDATRNFHVSGKVVASSDSRDMRLQRMMGHLPALIHPCPRSVLVVGCGAGVTAGSFVLYPDVERIVICEIEALIPPAAAKYFGLENHDVIRDPRVEIICDDARHYVLTTRERFDIITSDPIHPWVKGAAALYSQDYFEVCRQRLNPGGVVAQWVPLYESNLEAVKSEITTFLEVFPAGTIWSNDSNGEGYDTVLLGQVEPTRLEVDVLQQRLDRPDHGRVCESLRQVELDSARRLLATYAAEGADLRPWLQNAQINRDRDLRLQYLAGMGLNSYQANAIYRALGLHRRQAYRSVGEAKGGQPSLTPAPAPRGSSQ
jgi:spermidine synthase